MALELPATRLRSVNPATLELLAETPISTPAEIRQSLARARQTQESWGRLKLPQRLAFIESFRRTVFANREQIAELITAEAGKPLLESLGAEVFSVLETCSWLRAHAPSILSRERVSVNRLFFPFKKSYNVFEPLGVVAVISPWNFPFSIPAGTVLSALAAGNTVVLKPSPKTPLVAKRLGELFREAGFPEGTVEIVQGDKDEAKALVEGEVDRVVFTGSTSGGRAIMSLCAPKLHPVTLELGGKHPALVLSDSNIERCADALVWSAFTNAGQACASIERLYVEESIHDRLVAALIGRTRALRLGNPASYDTDVGPLIDAGQLARVRDLVARSLDAGARVVCGGRTPGEISPDAAASLPGYFMEPTIVTGVRQDMPLVRQEIFGPVLPVIKVSSAEEAVALANDSPLALGASIWTGDTARGEELALRIRAGLVWINDAMYSHTCPDAPWGGTADSGMGRTHGKHSLLEFVNTKHIGSEGQGKRDWNFPYDRLRADVMRRAVELTHGPSSLGKLKALCALLPKWLKLKLSSR